MSRVAKKPILLPAGVKVVIASGQITVTGPKGGVSRPVPDQVDVIQAEGQLRVQMKSQAASSSALAGTLRANLDNMVTGVSRGFERKLQLVGVGYRAQVKGQQLNLSVGLSHPVEFQAPASITLEMPTPTEIVIKGIDKQAVGQLAADIRSVRPPEPYKGKGIRYADEVIELKEGKKK